MILYQQCILVKRFSLSILHYTQMVSMCIHGVCTYTPVPVHTCTYTVTCAHIHTYMHACTRAHTEKIELYMFGGLWEQP